MILPVITPAGGAVTHDEVDRQAVAQLSERYEQPPKPPPDKMQQSKWVAEGQALSRNSKVWNEPTYPAAQVCTQDTP
jgi:hypothetical protein